MPKSFNNLNLLNLLNLFKDKNQQKSFFYLLIRSVSVLSNYILSILIIKLFSEENYGYYIFGLSIFMLLSVFLKFGVDIHFVKYISENKFPILPNWIRKVENKIFYISIIISGLISGFLYVYDSLTYTYTFLIIFILSVPFYVKVLLNSGKLRGLSKILHFAFLNIAGRVLITLIVFLLLYYIFSYKDSYSIFVSHSISILILLVISAFWIRKEFNFSNKLDDIQIPKNFFSYNNGLLIKSYVTVLFLWGDRFLLSLISSSSEVAQYDISLKIGMLIMIVIEALKSTYAPVFARHALEPEKLSKEIKISTRVGFLVSFLTFIFILVFGKFILSFFGTEFIDSYTTLLIISFGYVFASFFGQADSVLEMCGLIKHYIKYYSIIIFISLSVGALLSLSYGALGMAIGFSFGNILFQFTASKIVNSKMKIKTSFL